jgi:hypothetical protein
MDKVELSAIRYQSFSKSKYWNNGAEATLIVPAFFRTL